MKSIVTIAIADPNYYFAEGIRCGLTYYFNTRGDEARFVEEFSPSLPFDLVFKSLHHGEEPQFCRFPYETNQKRPLFFSIREKKEARGYRSVSCLSEAGVLYRNQGVNTLLHLVEHALEAQRPRPQACDCYRCQYQELTLREREVLRYLERGVSQMGAAKYMRLSVKTVNAHKQSVMKKLHLTRNSELFHWLLNGGLRNP